MLDRLCPIAFLLLVTSAPPLVNSAFAQSYFTDCTAQTGDNATVILPEAVEPTVDGQPLFYGSEIALFTPEGLCAGVAVWMEGSVSITAWGDNFLTDLKDGFASGEPLGYRVWDASEGHEYSEGQVDVIYDTSKSYFRNDGLYERNAIYGLAGVAVSSSSGSGAPAAPTLTYPQDGALDLPRPTMLRWDPINDASDYLIQIATNSSFNDNLLSRIVDRNTYTVDSLSAGTSYYWRIRARNGEGTGPWSRAFRFTTREPNRAPASLFPSEGMRDITTIVAFAWEQLVGADSYQVEVWRRTIADSMSLELDSTGIADTTLVAELEPSGTYAWRVRATSGGFWGAWSPLTQFQTRESPGDHPPLTAVRLHQNYPNPFNPETIIPMDLPDETHVVLTVFDLLGRHVATLADEVMSAGRHEIRWNAAEVPSGRYVYMLETDRVRRTRSLVLVR